MTPSENKRSLKELSTSRLYTRLFVFTAALLASASFAIVMMNREIDILTALQGILALVLIAIWSPVLFAIIRELISRSTVGGASSNATPIYIRLLRWIAIFWSVAAICLYVSLYIYSYYICIYPQEISVLPPSIIATLIFPVGVFIGYLIAFSRERLGGLLSIACIIAIQFMPYFGYFMFSTDFSIMLVYLPPAVLFMISSVYSRRKIVDILSICTSTLLLAIIVWMYSMPYPFSLWLESIEATRYSNTWPISRDDYNKAYCLVQSRLDAREIIDHIKVDSKRKIYFHTLRRYSGFLAAAGNSFTVIKESGIWKVDGWNPWSS